jgi:hypothetical protein
VGDGQNVSGAAQFFDHGAFIELFQFGRVFEVLDGEDQGFFPLPKNTFRALHKAVKRQHKSETDLDATAIEEFLEKANNTGKLVGLFANEPATIDQILGQAMDDREKVPL